MDEILKYVSETGFAILISVYLLVRMEKKMEVLTVCINELTSSINKINK